MSIEIDDLLGDLVKKTEERENKTSGRDSRLISLKPNKTVFKFRLLPNLRDKQLIETAQVYEWQSAKDKYTFAGFSPKTFDPSAEQSYYDKVRNELFDREDKERGKKLFPIPYSYVNIGVEQDPETPDNEGEVKVFRYKAKPHRAGVEDSGSPIHLAIQEAIEEHKGRIFDPSKKGLVLVLKVKKSTVGYKYDISFEDAKKEFKFEPDDIVDLATLWEKPLTDDQQKELVRTSIFGKAKRSSVIDDLDSGPSAEDDDDLPDLEPDLEPDMNDDPVATDDGSEPDKVSSDLDDLIDSMND